MKQISDTRYPMTRRIRIYDEDLADYYCIARPGEKIIFENRAANSSKLILILPAGHR